MKGFMSGHSKWATIKRQKGATDAKRGQLFTKLSNAITIAVRESGGSGDPNFNFKLRLAIDKAKAASMPKENIERAIAKATGAGAKTSFDEAIYEGFGPLSTAIIVEAATDNKQRTIQEVKNVFDRNGGTLANPGAVAYQFEQKGYLKVEKGGKSYDDIFLLGAEVGAEEVEDEGEEVIIYTKPENLKSVKDELEKLDIKVTDAELIRKPTTVVTISDKDSAQKFLDFIEKLEELNDVQKVFSNGDIADSIFSQL